MSKIKEVARKAHVSVGTVSNVLSGAVPVSKGLKEHPLEVMPDYYLNHVARSLKINRTKLMGLVVGNISDPVCRRWCAEPKTPPGVKIIS